MEAVEQPQQAEELRLLLEWDTKDDHRRFLRAGELSVAAHAAVIIALLLVPREAYRPLPVERHITPLIAPPAEITQREPNRAKISKDFNIEALLPRPRIQIPPSPPSTTRPKAPTLAMPTPKPAAPEALPEPPKIESASKGGPNPPGTEALAPPPPQIQTEEHPKLAFETPGGQSGRTGQGLGKVAVPSTSVSEATRNVVRGGGGGLTVGDVGVGEGGIGEALNQPPTPGKLGSNLELLSDPMGVDFRPYLLQILATVRRNWFSVMPESAKLGRRGNVAVQFAIAKNGEVTKVVFATNSGADALDRAAVASISMSNPFPPLPTEFRGNVVRLQFTFQYNAPAR
jgi:TonB family protein